jgi:hypothetical protein
MKPAILEAIDLPVTRIFKKGFYVNRRRFA